MGIYLDHAATTYVADEVLQEMLPAFSQNFGNASSLHGYGRQAAKVVDIARNRVAAALGAKASEIYFTSGGTESDNWALRGVAYANREKGNHIITSQIEHHAILNTCKQLEKEGFEVSYIGVDRFGKIKLDELKSAFTDKTILVSVMMANNEVGTIQPIAEIGACCRARGVLFHTDAVQAVGSLPIDVKAMNIDLLSLSAHKFYGPKGIGALYIRTGVRMGKLINGGSQERHMRGGTTNTPGIVGLGKAIELATTNLAQKSEAIAILRDTFIEQVERRIPYVTLNGHRTERLPNNVNFSFEFIEGESILLSLDLAGIAVSSGSACTSGSLEPSHVLLAMGVDVALAHGSIRFTFGKCNSLVEVNQVAETLVQIIENLRNMSPLFEAQRGECKNV